ncbi:MAG: ribosomal protection-like ABC-F family protein [Acidimicrobiia bacterium]
MLSARSVTKSFDGTPVLAGVSLSITDGARLGIVGRNGAGKTTLLRMLAGVEDPDGGSIDRAPLSTSVGYLPQETDAQPGETLRAYLARRTGVAAASQHLDETTAALSGDDESIAAYSDALESFLAIGGDDFDARVGEVCATVGLPVSRLDVEVGVLSGGEASRAALAAILLSRVDVLLLDEPTNDLDFAGLDLLESFLVGRSGGLAVVSHDRAFLDRTCTRVIELHEEHHTATEFAGGWSDYVAARDLERSQQYAAHEKWSAERSALKSRVQSQREWSSQGIKKAKKSGETDKFIRNKNKADSEKLVGKVRISEKALDRLERERVDKPWEGWELRLELGAATRPGDVVARLVGATVRRDTFTLGPVNLEIGGGEHVAILGRNGSGKSTLLGLITGAIEPDDGTVWRGPSVVFGTMDQSRVALDPGSTLLDAFTTDTGMLAVDARTLLAKFSLGADHVTRHVGDLSPGERTRAILAALSARGVNCLVLDEPTNHLDLEAIEQLEGALADYDGTLLLVTHDRAFLDHVSVHRTIDVDQGTVTERSS